MILIYIYYIYTVYICIFIWYTPCFDHGAYVCFYRFSQAVAFGVCCPHPGRMNFSTVMNSLPQRCPKKRHEKHKKPLDCSLVGGLFPLPPVFHFFKKKQIYISHFLSQLIPMHHWLLMTSGIDENLPGHGAPWSLAMTEEFSVNPARVWRSRHHGFTKSLVIHDDWMMTGGMPMPHDLGNQQFFRNLKWKTTSIQCG